MVPNEALIAGCTMHSQGMGYKFEEEKNNFKVVRDNKYFFNEINISLSFYNS